jgi:rare lipoprotein A
MRTHWRPQLFVAALIMLSVSGCASDQSSSKPSPSPEESKQAVAAKAETKTDQTVNGRATWYGPGLYGNKTTSGDVLEKGTMTAAHSSLPMGTKVKVSILDTGESVTVEINDRKPYKEGTVIDLAHGAADALNIDEDGTASVSIEVLD